MNVTFYWQGIGEKAVYGRWGDGLKAAMKLVEEKYTVKYQEPWEPCDPNDIVLYWESPCTAAGKDRDNYERVRNLPNKKILLFAGGPIKHEWCTGFDMFLVESKLNEEEFEAEFFPWARAFGVDTDVMYKEKQPKMFDAVFPATCAGWKRQGLFSRALKDKGVVCGRYQPSDPIGFILAREQGTFVLPELTYEALRGMYNASHCCVNTSEYWGGGQRTTLESMACGTPVVVMSDSPKNREYVEESGFGVVCEPEEQAIRDAVKFIKDNPEKFKPEVGIQYVQSKWSHKHYSENIIKAIEKLHEEK